MKKQFHVFVKKLSQTNMNWSAMHLPLSLTNKRSYMKQYPIHSPRQETKRHRLTHVLTHSHLFCFNKLCVKNQWDIHINGVLTNLCSNKRWVLTKKNTDSHKLWFSQISHNFLTCVLTKRWVHKKNTCSNKTDKAYHTQYSKKYKYSYKCRALSLWCNFEHLMLVRCQAR